MASRMGEQWYREQARSKQRAGELEFDDDAKVSENDDPRGSRGAYGMAEKRAHYVLEKWSGRGWYDYGTVVDLGWLTREGHEIAAAEIAR